MIDLQTSAQINSSSFLLPLSPLRPGRRSQDSYTPSPPPSPCSRAVLKIEAAGSSLVEGCKFEDRKL